MKKMNFEEFWAGFETPKTDLGKAMKYKSETDLDDVSEAQLEWIFEIITKYDQSDKHPDDVEADIDCCVEELKIFHSVAVAYHETRCMEWERKKNEIHARAEHLLLLKVNVPHLYQSVIDQINMHLNGEHTLEVTRQEMKDFYPNWSESDFRELLELTK